MRFNKKYSLDDKLNTVLDNKHPGSTDLAILSFLKMVFMVEHSVVYLPQEQILLQN